MNRLFTIVAVTCAFALAEHPTTAATVYNNTSSPSTAMHTLLPGGSTDSPDQGNEISLSGPERMVTNLTVRMRIRGGCAASMHIRARFYRNDGPGGAPGTMFWDSGPIFAAIDSGVDIPYNFAVPSVRVPSFFTYTV